MYKTKKIFNKKIVLITFFILIIFIFYFTGLNRIFSFQNFSDHREQLLLSVKNNYWFSVFTYILVYIAIVISSLPLAGTLTVIGGFLFETLPATFYSVVAGTVGSTLAFLVLRYFLGRMVQEKYKDKLQKFNRNIQIYGSSYLLVIQLIGFVPFFVINTLAALTTISLKTFILTTAIGIIPINFVYAYAGRQLSTINNFSEILSANVLIGFGFLALLSLLSIIIKKLYLKSKGI